MRESEFIDISTARFANVAFSDGSLLYGFNQRFAKRQPIAAPNDVKRYFVTPQESGELCIMSCVLGDNRDIFFPKLSEDLHLTTFSEIAERYLNLLGYEPYLCSTEQEARDRIDELIPLKRWPCFFFESDTTGEKDFEEFYTDNENLDIHRFASLGIVKNRLSYDLEQLNHFTETILDLRSNKSWGKEDLVALFTNMIPEFSHIETGKYLDGKM